MPFGSLSRGANSSGVFGYGRPMAANSQPLARFRANYPASATSYRPYLRDGFGRPFFSAFRNRLVPNFVGYPFGYDPFFDGDDYGYGQADQSASQSYPQQAAYASPEDYGSQQVPYPSAEQDPSGGYRPAYQNSGAPDPPATLPPTTLVFQDGRPTEQVRNYVLTRTTLYDLDGNSHSDIPIAALNLAATIEANRARGIDFSLPAGY
jgi:hypothetical protein